MLQKRIIIWEQKNVSLCVQIVQMLVTRSRTKQHTSAPNVRDQEVAQYFKKQIWTEHLKEGHKNAINVSETKIVWLGAWLIEGVTILFASQNASQNGAKIVQMRVKMAPRQTSGGFWR